MTVRGTVQGVGFRPFVYRLAMDHHLVGSVLNQGEGATVDFQGAPSDLAAATKAIQNDLPSPGLVEYFACESLPPDLSLREFTILKSQDQGQRRMALAPDGAVCPACLGELADHDDRRFAYPFINCTHCGPRFTITRALPYDRPQTTMADFVLCPDCSCEYSDPLDRRYHAQPVACPSCGPHAWLLTAGDVPTDPDALMVPDKPEHPGLAIEQAQQMLLAGQLLVIKGLGGFHLAVNARDPQAVARLRRKKMRQRKPLAVMVRDLETARRCVQLDAAAERLLTSTAAPIVLAPVLDQQQDLAPELAPGLHELGIMLPYTPLHQMLFSETLDALVMTSGNPPSYPIIVDNQQALRQLPGDAFVLHNRDIHVACDDSVVRSAGQEHVTIRRARGYVPKGRAVPFLPERSVLAMGAHLKVTQATLQRGELVLGRHLGDLSHPQIQQAYRRELARLLDFGRVDPEIVAVDLHPDLYSTQYAQELFADRTIVPIQHHHAHLCSAMVEHALPQDSEVVAIVLDGLGYGSDGAIWGCEILRGGYHRFERVAHLRYVAQPGGDRAAQQPLRMATSLLLDAGISQHPALQPDYAQVLGIAAASPLSSSAGRLFDGVAAILGVAPEVQEYEAEAAMVLEAIADRDCGEAYAMPIDNGQLDTRVLVSQLVADTSSVPVRAAKFHNGLADACAQAALAQGVETVVLSGGCLVNNLLRQRLQRTLRRKGVKVLGQQDIPPGDGGLSVGQAAAAACMVEKGVL